MKNIIQKNKKWAVLLSATAMLFLGSCKSDYLDTEPTAAVSESVAFSSAAGVMSIINGMHRDLYSRQTNNNNSQGQNGQGGIMIIMDALGEDLVFPSTGNNWYISTVRWQDQANANSDYAFYPYQLYYALIRNANLVIARAPGVPVGSNEEANTIKTAIGEAHAFRAFCYYMLVQIYGKRYVPNTNNSQLGVPIRLIADESSLARSTVEEVYKQINLDLNEALVKLASTKRTSKSHFDKQIVQGLIARVALTQGNYSLAAASANSARSEFKLMDNSAYLSGFNNLGNQEWMWGSAIAADQGDSFSNFGAYMSRNYNSTNIRQAPKAMNTKLYAMFPKTDVRKKVVDSTGKHLDLALPATYAKFPYTSQKFLSVSTSDSRVDLPLMRAAEMYLIEAEALAKMNQESASKAVFLQLQKNRDESYKGTVKTGAAYIDEILNSRRIELWGEGFRFLDLKRLNMNLDRTGANHSSTVVNNLFTAPNTDKRWEFLIPLKEINANPLIVQNPL